VAHITRKTRTKRGFLFMGYLMKSMNFKMKIQRIVITNEDCLSGIFMQAKEFIIIRFERLFGLPYFI